MAIIIPSSSNDAAPGDDYSAIQAALDAGGFVSLIPGRTYGLSRELVQSVAGTVFHCHRATLKMLATGTNTYSNMVKLTGDRAKLIKPVLDGNVQNRETDLATNKRTSGFLISDASNCLVDRPLGRNLGYIPSVSAADVVALGNSQLGRIERTDSASRHVEGNRVVGGVLEDPDLRCAFFLRMRTAFDGLSAGPWKVHGNSFVGGEATGTGKNSVELIGPDTVGNTVSDITIHNTGASDVIEADFGASDNLFLRCKVIGAVANAARGNSLNGFSAGGTDKSNTIPGDPLKRPLRNRFVDCEIKDIDLVQDGVFVRGFVDDGGIGTEFVNPSMHDVDVTGAGSATRGIQTIRLVVHGDNEERIERLSVVNPTISGVDIGIYLATQDGTVVDMRVEGGTIVAADSALKANSDCTVMGLRVVDTVLTAPNPPAIPTGSDNIVNGVAV